MHTHQSASEKKKKNEHHIYVPIAKKQSIPTIKNIFSVNDGLDLASMHLRKEMQTNAQTQHTTKNRELFINISNGYVMK